MKKIGLILMLVLLVGACDKNQKSVKKLDGTWIGTHFIWTSGGSTVDHIETGYLDFEYTFEVCKLKNEDGCVLNAKNIINSGGTASVTEIPYTYTISADGTKMIWMNTSFEDDVWDIETLTNTDLVISHTTPSGGAFVEMHFEKE